MDGYSRKEREWVGNSSDTQRLELSLGPPGGGWTTATHNNGSWMINQQHPCAENQARKAVKKNGPSQPSSNRVAVDLNKLEEKSFPNTAVPNANSSAPNHKRTAAPSPVVGWPPIRSFRKSIRSSKPKDLIPEENLDEKGEKTLLVKINMDGVPIGRKVDIRAYDNYEKLLNAVDELFRGLLAAQSDISKVGRGLVNGNGEYTLVYEDNEGDRMLVGDVPWHIFVLTVKRLRVLKSSRVIPLTS